MTDKGIKFDGEKLRWDLLPYDALEEVVKVYTVGAKKYADRNWEKGISCMRMIAALMRHLVARIFGEVFDKENGQRHMASVVWIGLALLTYEVRDMKEFLDYTPIRMVK